MVCPKCGEDENHFVYNSRSNRRYIWRRRECASCGHRFTTAEIPVVDVGSVAEELKQKYSRVIRRRLKQA